MHVTDTLTSGLCSDFPSRESRKHGLKAKSSPCLKQVPVLTQRFDQRNTTNWGDFKKIFRCFKKQANKQKKNPFSAKKKYWYLSRRLQLRHPKQSMPPFTGIRGYVIFPFVNNHVQSMSYTNKQWHVIYKQNEC